MILTAFFHVKNVEDNIHFLTDKNNRTVFWFDIIFCHSPHAILNHTQKIYVEVEAAHKLQHLIHSVWYCIVML